MAESDQVRTKATDPFALFAIGAAAAGPLAWLGVLLVLALGRMSSIVILNNTAVPLTVRSGGHDVNLPPGGAAELPWASEFDLVDGGGWVISHYRWTPVRDRLRFRFEMQVEPDGRLYLLESGGGPRLFASPPRKPVKILPPQPGGYPLVPSVSFDQW